MITVDNWHKPTAAAGRWMTHRVQIRAQGMSFLRLNGPPEDVYFIFERTNGLQEFAIYIDEPEAQMMMATLRDFLERRQAMRLQLARNPNPLDDADRIRMKLVPE